MTPEILTLLAILALAVALFVTEWLTADLVALLVLGSLALSGLVTPVEALSGFSSPTVITVWAVFVLSAALSTTGVARVVGRQVLRLAGTNEIQLVAVIMLTAGVLSAFMNNIGVAALLLPVVMDIARRTGRPPARLLMPLAFGVLLGGLTTLIGTPPNILVSDALRDYGLRPFGLFEYAPVGVLVMLTGVAFMALIGRHLLPSRDIAREFSAPNQTDLGEFYNAVLAPHSRLAGQSLRQIRFREKYELNVLAIQHEGQVYHSNLRDMALHFGDAVLLYGPREKLSVLTSDPDFLILTETAQVVKHPKKAVPAVLVMAAVLLPVILGWLPIAITAVVGATLMVMIGCLTMEEAYRSIEWKAVFLIAGMLPLGIAMEQTGAASFLAEGMVGLIGEMGPLMVVASLFILTTLASQVMPNAAVAVLLAPIALNTANDLAMSPYALMMTVAVAASASFLSPVAHPANVLIMGPGGYRFADYLKVGLPLTLVLLVVTVLVLPIFWPLFP